MQATYKARVLSSKYRTMRQRIMIFQSYCRGFIARKEYNQRLASIIKIQSGMRMVLAQRQASELRVEVCMYQRNY